MKIPEFKTLGGFLKNDKTAKIVFFGGIILIFLILLTDIIQPSEKAIKTSGALSYEQSAEKYEEALERKLIGIISEINGAAAGPEQISVMITLENLEENVYSGRETAVATVKTPRVRGVAVVCAGGANAVTREKIVLTVSRALGISTARVSVTN